MLGLQFADQFVADFAFARALDVLVEFEIAAGLVAVVEFEIAAGFVAVALLEVAAKFHPYDDRLLAWFAVFCLQRCRLLLLE